MKKIKLFSLVLLVAIFVFVAKDSLAVQRESLFERAGKTVDALMFIRSEIDDKYKTYLNTHTYNPLEDAIEEKLPLLEIRINTLKDQVRVFDANLERERINLKDLRERIVAVQFELSDLGELAEMREVEMARSRQLLNEFLRIAYDETMQYTDWKTGEMSTLKFLFTDDNLADVETKKVYLNILQNIMAELVSDLQVRQEKYLGIKKDLLAKRGRLILLQQEVLDRTENLQKMRDAKALLLQQTQGQEEQFRRLIIESKQQEAEALAEIGDLKSQLTMIDSQLKGLKNNLSEDEFQKLLRDQNITGLSGVIFPNQIPRVLWPVSPARGITAFFGDSGYKSRFGVAHRAVDIRLPQGSRVMAAAPGLVYKAKNNGYGYSYITIAHPGGLATVYGHISGILVKEGDVVRAGDLIGLSGGIPGTKGAGYMTTGAHLHFEVADHGENKDPLDFLPLEQMRLRDIPARFMKEAVRL